MIGNHIYWLLEKYLQALQLLRVGTNNSLSTQ